MYEDRNLLALLLTRYLRYSIVEGEEYDWPVLFLLLDNGLQISYHIPRELVELLNFKISKNKTNIWDNHTKEEKRNRIIKFIKEANFGN
jgi:hypothetical protein